ncbi:MAG: ABC transporter substrate-binding protein, partial [Lacisediminihabitans sp.]
MFKKRQVGRTLAAAVALSVGLALAGCSSTGASSGGDVKGGDYSGPKVTVTFWNGWTGGAAPVLVPKLVAK